MRLRPRHVLWLPVLLAPFAPLACWTFRLPGPPYRGELPATDELTASLQLELRADVEALAPAGSQRRADHLDEIERAARYLESRLSSLGYTIHSEPVPLRLGALSRNLEVERPGRSPSKEILIVGAHYDAAAGAAGADDNASGCAALLALAARFARIQPERTVRFILFTSEEPPFFWTPQMGSRVSADAARARGDRITGMVSLESLGYFRNAEGSQHYPFPLDLFYPSTGDFVAFVGETRSAPLVKQLGGAFRRHARIGSEGAAVPGNIAGVGFSDHSSYWRIGVPAVMVTDTALFRNPHYHTPGDTPDTLDYARLAEVVRALGLALEELASSTVPR
jgi:Zn-dependent M28 family amino/carboxypeptidase